jgi:sugar O-acyltransferase (sialic acid O-acetyltransferase NeuD family)
MSKPKLILIGAGGHAQSCIDVIEHQNCYDVAGLVGSSEELNSWVLGYQIFATDLELRSLSQQYPWALVTVGQIKTPQIRMRLYKDLVDLGFKLPTIVSPTAYVSPRASLGPGTIVMHGAVINAGAHIGRNCIINSCALIEHGVNIGDHTHISTGAILNGDSLIGSGSYVGSAAVIREGIKVGDGCLIGMGLSVRHNLLNGVHFLGDKVHD